MEEDAGRHGQRTDTGHGLWHRAWAAFGRHAKKIGKREGKTKPKGRDVLRQQKSFGEIIDQPYQRYDDDVRLMPHELLLAIQILPLLLHDRCFGFIHDTRPRSSRAR